jgi:hypothetical protein
MLGSNKGNGEVEVHSPHDHWLYEDINITYVQYL